MKSYNFKKANFLGLYETLATCDWSFLDHCSEVNLACSEMYKLIYSIFDKYVPLYVPRRLDHPVWYTRELVANLNRKKKAYSRFKRFGNDVDRIEYRRLRSLVKLQLVRDYENYIRALEVDISSNPTHFWSYVDARRGATRVPGRMTDHNDQPLESPNEIVDAFAGYFSSVFARDFGGAAACIRQRLPPNFDICSISVSSVEDTIMRLKGKFTAGMDGIPAFIVRDCRASLAQALSRLFNLSLATSTFPDAWKEAKVTPVHKDGDRSRIVNYRPISVISNFAKVFEMSVYCSLFPVVKYFISPYQHGFYPGRSTGSSLICFSQYLNHSIDRGGQVDAMYADFSKAFDQLSHNILISKLAAYGFSDSLLRFVRSYLNGRKYTVYYRGCVSAPYLGTSGVPQGSNLGPFLFNLFVNDLLSNLTCQKLMYADDLKIFNSISTPDDCLSLQLDLHRLSEWAVTNGLLLNIGKCKVVTFCKRKNPQIYTYYLSNSPLTRVETVKDLGIYFQSDLSFGYHIQEVTKSAYKILGFIIRNSQSFRNVETLKTLYFSLVRTRLEYCSIVWAPYYSVYKGMLEAVQRKFLKFLYYRKHGIYPEQGFDHGSLCAEFDIKPLEVRRVLSSVVFLYKLVNCEIDCDDLLTRLNFRRPRDTDRVNVVFSCPQVRTNLGLGSPLYLMQKHFNVVASRNTNCNIFLCSRREIVSFVFSTFAP